MWLRNLRSWCAFSPVSTRRAGQRRSTRRVGLRLEALEDRIAPAKIAYLVAGLGGQGGIQGGIFPASLITSLQKDGFEVDLANWNSDNYLVAPSPYTASSVPFGNLNGDPGYFTPTVTASFTTPNSVLGIKTPSFTIPTAVGFQTDIGSPTQDSFVNAALTRLTALTGQNTIVLIGHSLGGSAVLDLAQQLDQQDPAVPIAMLGLLDPVGYAPSSGQALNAVLGATDVLNSLSTPSIPYLGIPAIGLQPVSFLNGVSNNADNETPGFRGDAFGGGVVRGPVPANVEYFYNRWQTNSLFPVDFPEDGEITSNATISDQAVQNTTAPYSIVGGNPLNILGLFTPYVDLDPIRFTTVNLGITEVDVPSGFNSDFLKSTAQLHYNFPQNATVDAELADILSDLTNNGLVVSDTNASGPGSLAQAVANADVAAGASVITFDPGMFATPQTIPLTRTLELQNPHAGASITIVGPPAGVTIAGSFPDNYNADPFSIFTVAANTHVKLEGLTIADGYAVGNGGGIDNAGTLTLTGCTIGGNFSGANGDGGGIANSGTLTVTQCTIEGNSAGVDGGGIYDSGTLTVTNTTISGNIAAISSPAAAIGNGGGIFDQPPRGSSIAVTLTNVTITGNGTGIDGGGICSAFGVHGGPTLTLNYCTITGNDSGEGGGIANTGTLVLNNTILAGNTATTDPDLFSDMNNKAGSFDSNGHNIIGGAVSWLAPLNYYGGPTQTMALLPGSPALGAGLPIAPITTDERGFNRSSHPDEGAYQTQGSSSLVVNSTADPVINVYGFLGPSFSTNLLQGSLAMPSGQLTLREAVNLANVTPAANTITFAAGAGQPFASAQTILLAAGLELDNTTSFVFAPPIGGLARPLFGITARSSITIDGSAAGITLAGDYTGAAPVITVAANTIASLENLTIGKAFGTFFRGIVSGFQVLLFQHSAIDNDSGATLTLTNCTVTDNAVTGSGGGIDNAGAMTIDNSTISDNEAVGGNGGGIANSGTITIANATISGNSAGSHGGGIWNAAGSMTVTTSEIDDDNSAPYDGGIGNVGTLTVADSTIANNTAQDNVGGIGNSGALTLVGSTVSGNAAQGGLGGGVFNDVGATLTIANDTITSNTAKDGGGGIDNQGALAVTNATVADNSAADGGGIDNGGALTLSNSIAAGNIANTNADLDTDGLGGNNANLVGSGAAMLAPLGNYGGPTQTIALLPGSLALGAGAGVTTMARNARPTDQTIYVNDAAAIAVTPGAYFIFIDGEEMEVTNVDLATTPNSLTVVRGINGITATLNQNDPVYLATDERGFSRPTSQPDLGAFQTQSGTSLVVTSTVDPVGNTPIGSFTGGTSGQLTLREAVNLANLLLSSTITFAAAAPQTITLGATLVLENAITIDGSAAGVTIAGGGGASNFSVLTVTQIATATVEDLTIAHGHTAGNGGGIDNNGNLAVIGVTLLDNTAVNGGGIENTGTLTLVNSTLIGNAAVNGQGGGLDNEGDADSTVSNASIAGNSATKGGGIASPGILTLNNTIVTANSAATLANVDGTFNGNKHNTIGSGLSPIFALAPNGGPTETIALSPGSPALGKGGAVTPVGDEGVGPTDTTIFVNNAAALAGTSTGVNLFIRIDSEIMLVTQVAGDALTVERGFFNTTAASHSPGAGVFLATDQRGVLRSTTAPNIGAFESSTKPLTTWLDTTPASAPFGQTVELTAAVTGPLGMAAGSVLFLDGSTTLGTAPLIDGVASIAATALTGGSHTITAIYQGATTSTSNAVTVDITLADTSIAGTLTPANPAQDQSLTFTATVSAIAPAGSAPTGAVQFQIDDNPASNVELSAGSATLTLPNGLAPGPHVLTAMYLGDADYNASSIFTLNLAGANITALLTPANPLQNQPATFIATVTPMAPADATPTGLVQFQVDGSTISTGALADGTASLILPNGLAPGAHVLTATYLGSGTFNASAPFTLNLAGTTISGTLSPATLVANQAFTFTATVAPTALGEGTPTGFVQFQVDQNPPSAVALAAGQASLTFPNGLPNGAHVITATYLGDGNFNASSTLTQDIAFGADLAVTASASAPSVLDGQNLTYTITVANDGPATANGITLTDTLPAGVTLVSASCGQGIVTIGTGSVSLALSSLSYPASVALTLVVTATAGAGSAITNTASVTAATPDPNLENNSATVLTTAIVPIVVTDATDLTPLQPGTDNPLDVDGDVSLRSAIAAANVDAANGISDTITFAPGLAGDTIALDNELGLLELSGAPQTGSATITIDANALPGGITIRGTPGAGVFEVDHGVTAVLDALNIAAGSTSVNGGGIDNAGDLTVEACTIIGNVTTEMGGGIYNTGILTALDCTIGGNTAAPGGAITDASVGYGAGIYNTGTTTLIGTTISNNTGQDGAGLANYGTLIVSNSTISGNTAQDPDGGGGGLENAGTATLVNSTVSYNTASYGDGLWNARGSMTLINVTVSGNASGQGAGILNYAVLVMQNTIVAGNPSTIGPDVYNRPGFGGTVTANDCLIGVAAASGITGGTGNILDPKVLDFAPLGNYGGPTQTIALLPGSPAIDAGAISLAVDANGNPLTTDQRGDPRLADGTVDIGAYELE